MLPGFRAMAQTADVLVSNGDLVSNGSTANYTSYLSALAAGGGGEYGTVVSTIGNHEYYGSEGSAVYRERFLDSTGMRDIGGQGGLWGEVLVDGQLPLIWIGSEFYDYTAKTGAGPFVDFSEEQFTWLRDRLAHWRAQDQPVLLFSHHLLPYSVSGSYARFYENDFGQEEARFAALLAQNPNVIMFNSHTHWSPTLNDWSTELRPDPTRAQRPHGREHRSRHHDVRTERGLGGEGRRRCRPRRAARRAVRRPRARHGVLLLDGRSDGDQARRHPASHRRPRGSGGPGRRRSGRSRRSGRGAERADGRGRWPGHDLRNRIPRGCGARDRVAFHTGAGGRRDRRCRRVVPHRCHDPREDAGRCAHTGGDPPRRDRGDRADHGHPRGGRLRRRRTGNGDGHSPRLGIQWRSGCVVHGR
ncbi:metallophosphoesterase [Microbacterium oxydans]|nr:metallophosphoesterase [Microbacterium oxydans]